MIPQTLVWLQQRAQTCDYRGVGHLWGKKKGGNIHMGGDRAIVRWGEATKE